MSIYIFLIFASETFYIINSANMCTLVGPNKIILCFGQPDPTYRNRPTLDFFAKLPGFFVGVFIIEVSI